MPTSITNHRRYDDYGNLISESNTAVDELFGYTGRAFDESTGLQNNLHRWHDSKTGRWISEDPIGFGGGDTNLARYVGNNPLKWTDPSGLAPAGIVGKGVWSTIGKALGKKYSAETCEHAWKDLTKELLTILKGKRPDSYKVKEITEQLKKNGWREGPLQKSKHGLNDLPLDQGGGVVFRKEVDGEVWELQWHPGGGQHGPDPYWKFTSSKTGKIHDWEIAKLSGAACAFSLVPGSLIAEANTAYWSWLYDWAYDDLYGEEGQKNKVQWP